MPWFSDIESISKIGFVGLLIFFLFLLLKGEVFLGRELKDLRWQLKDERKKREKAERERDQWVRFALKGHEISRHAIRALDQAGPPKEEEAADAESE